MPEFPKEGYPSRKFFEWSDSRIGYYHGSCLSTAHPWQLYPPWLKTWSWWSWFHQSLCTKNFSSQHSFRNGTLWFISALDVLHISHENQNLWSHSAKMQINFLLSAITVLGNVANCRMLFMDIFRIHSIALRLGLTLPAHMHSPIGHYQKCGTTRTSPHLLKE